MLQYSLYLSASADMPESAIILLNRICMQKFRRVLFSWLATFETFYILSLILAILAKNREIREN